MPYVMHGTFWYHLCNLKNVLHIFKTVQMIPNRATHLICSTIAYKQPSREIQK